MTGGWKPEFNFDNAFEKYLIPKISEHYINNMFTNKKILNKELEKIKNDGLYKYEREIQSEEKFIY